MKINVYVDGFNLYYGCLKGTPYRWLDLGKLCQILLPGDSINRIRYFTALVKPEPSDPQKHIRQQTLLRALQTIPHLTIHYGHFLSHSVRMPLAKPPATGARTVEVLKMEEKGSDVNLATHLLVDGFDNDYEAAVIISNDSDLLEPINVVRKRLRLTLGILNPHRNRSRELSRAADFYRPIRAGALSASQFPPTLRDANGIIMKPQGW